MHIHFALSKMADVNSITDYIKTSEVLDYFTYVCTILTILRTTLSDEFSLLTLTEEEKEIGWGGCYSDSFEQEFEEYKTTAFKDGRIIVFGGFVRDVIAGIPLEELKKKDVDVSIRLTEPMRSFLTLSKVREILEKKFSGMYSDFEMIGEPWTPLRALKSYSLIGVMMDGIRFDFTFSEQEDRFAFLHDFTCNNLAFDISDGVLFSRLPGMNIDECVQDISSRSLRDMSMCTFVCREGKGRLLKLYMSDLAIRQKKMIESGYTLSNPYTHCYPDEMKIRFEIWLGKI